MTRSLPRFTAFLARAASVLLFASALPSPAFALPPVAARSAEAMRVFQRRVLAERLASPGPSAITAPADLYDPADDALWSSDFALPEFDDPVTVTVEFRGELIVGGTFTQASGIPAYHVARWNGQRWAPLGDGLRKIVPLALGVVGDRLYAGGYVENWLPGVRNVVYVWDGTGWSNVSSNLADGMVESLADYQGTLVAGGRFTLDQYTESSAVVRLSGSVWLPVGSTPDLFVTELASNGPVLYAGIAMGPSPPSPLVPAVLTYSGGAWDTLARARSKIEGSAPVIGALAVTNGDLYVGGWFDQVNAVQTSGVARLHSGTWTAVDAGPDTYVSALRPTAAGLVVAGYYSSIGGTPTFSISRWNGGGWETFGSGLWYGVETLCEYGGRLVAGGLFTQTGDLTQTLMSLASWDGSTWTRLRGTAPIGAGILGFSGDSPARALEVLDGSLYLGGSFFFENDLPFWSPSRGVARWNGWGWQPIGARDFNGTVNALTWYDNHLIVAGSFGLSIPPLYATNIARWTGTTWEPLGTGVDDAVYALAVHGGDLYAAGSFRLAGGLLCSGIARWNGSVWRPVGPPVTPSPSPVVYALEEWNGKLYAAGNFSAIGNTPILNVARWSDTEWEAVGTGIDGPVMTLEIHDGELWAGGEQVEFPAEAPVTVSHWDGSSWSHPPVQPDDVVTRLLSTGGDLFAAGWFKQIGGDVMNGVARLDDAGWHGLGQGLAGNPSRAPVTLAAFEGGLWAGGTFTRAGGKSSFHVARWDGLPTDPARPVTFSPARPNPFQFSTTVRFLLPTGAIGTASVLDLSGRVVRTLRRGSFGSGPVDVTWDGRDDDGVTQPAGVYFIRVHSNAGSRAARVAFIP